MWGGAAWYAAYALAAYVAVLWRLGVPGRVAAASVGALAPSTTHGVVVTAFGVALAGDLVAWAQARDRVKSQMFAVLCVVNFLPLVKCVWCVSWGRPFLGTLPLST